MPAIIPAVAAVAGAAISARGAKKAAETQANAASQGAELAVEENRRQFDVVRELLQPYVDAGRRGLSGYESLAGLMGADAQRGAIDGVMVGPEFNYLTKQGEDAILANASATGGLRMGNTQTALADWRQGVLSSLIERQVGRYGNLATMGQNSAAGVGTAAMNMGNQNAALINGAANQAGAAQAGGQLAGARALTGAIGTIGGIATANGWQPSTAPTSVLPSVGFGTGAQFGNQDYGAYF